MWTTVRNNLSPQTSVSGSDLERKALLQLNYNMSTEQVTLLPYDPMTSSPIHDGTSSMENKHGFYGQV